MSEEEMTARYKGKRCLVLPLFRQGTYTFVGTIGKCYWQRDRHEGNYHWHFQVFTEDGDWRILRQDEIRVD